MPQTWIKFIVHGARIMNNSQYKNNSIPFTTIRKWPNNTITVAPKWCSVDLRDGNQSLPVPMNFDKKLKMFNMLKYVGFRQIEIGYPSASKAEFDFIKNITDFGATDGIECKVLVPCINSHIDTAISCLKTNKNNIFHLYNSTSPIQREHVFNKSKKEIIKLAVDSVHYLFDNTDNTTILQYSPESFTATELEFSAEICNAVIDAWQKRNIIINLPSTVEIFTPNIFADYVEYMKNVLPSTVELAIHTHNDRGTAVASAEMAILAGASIVEGTLFGNGERAGNCDIVNMALNIHTSGIDCKLDFSDMNSIEEMFHDCTGMNIHERHPYVGSLYLTAFSGTHQDAINKTIKLSNTKWEIPYLPINPKDIGKDFNIRVNSQSGKGGISFILQHYFNIMLPQEILKNFANYIKNVISANEETTDLNPEKIINYLRDFIEVGLIEDSDVSEFNSLNEMINITNINITEYYQYSLGHNSNSDALTIMSIAGSYYMYVDSTVENSAKKCLFSYILTRNQ
jgi:2-isopropylmalate synthase